MDVNVRGTFLPCKHAGKIFKEQGHGKIVTISSVRAFAGHPGGYAAYGTSKGAVNLLTKQLATEWAKYHINVNSIAPCIAWTPLTQEVLENKQLYDIFMSRIPLGRAAVTQDFIGAAVYLASAGLGFCDRPGSVRGWRNDGGLRSADGRQSRGDRIPNRGTKKCGDIYFVQPPR